LELGERSSGQKTSYVSSSFQKEGEGAVSGRKNSSPRQLGKGGKVLRNWRSGRKTRPKIYAWKKLLCLSSVEEKELHQKNCSYLGITSRIGVKRNQKRALLSREMGKSRHLVHSASKWRRRKAISKQERGGTGKPVRKGVREARCQKK